MNVRKAEEPNFSQPGEKKKAPFCHITYAPSVFTSFILKHENAQQLG